MKRKSRYLFNSFMLFSIVLLAFILTCSDFGNKPPQNDYSKENNKVISNKSQKIVLKEELPQLPFKHIDLGDLKMDENGNSVGRKTELTELKKNLHDSEIGGVIISWNWVSSKFPSMPMKLSYNKSKHTLTLKYVENNVKEKFSNINDDCLSEFLTKGNKSYYAIGSYCNNSLYDFDNRQMTIKAAGNKPEQSEWDGGVKIVEDYVKKTAKDPSSIKFIEWSKVTAAGEYWIVRCKFIGTNSFGATVTENAWFYIQNGNIVDMKIIE